MKKLALAALSLSFACAVPRSGILGMTASPLAAGGAEAAVSGGVAYPSDTPPPDIRTVAGTTITSSQTVSGFTFPAFEGNLAYGINDSISFNLHGSGAGLQPGVKINLLKGDLNVAVLPAIAIGYESFKTTTAVTSGNTTQS